MEKKAKKNIALSQPLEDNVILHVDTTIAANSVCPRYNL